MNKYDFKVMRGEVTKKTIKDAIGIISAYCRYNRECYGCQCRDLCNECFDGKAPEYWIVEESNE